MPHEFETLYEMLEQKRYLDLKSALEHEQTADIAEFIDDIEEDRASIIVFRLLPKEIAAEVFSRLSVEKQTDICSLINDEELQEIMNDLYFDDMIDLLEEVPAYLVKRIMRQKGEKERNLINKFLNYKDGTAGCLMTIEFVDLHKDMTAAEALVRIRRDALDKETVYTCYVIDNERKLEGTVSLRDIVVADENTVIEDIMADDPVFVMTSDDQEDVADVFQKYDLLAVPVVDNERRLVGIITIDDIMDVIEEETTEDIMKMNAVTPSQEEYLDMGVFAIARKRVVWLLLLMISATFTGVIIRSFEDALQSAVILTSFIPMLMDTGGNAGSQASTTVIRAITLGEISLRDIFKVLFKEFRVSLIAGGILSIVNFARLFFLEKCSVLVCLVVSITLVATVIFAKIVGGTLPILAKSIHLDPALMASPLITTIVDAVSLLIYFSIASSLLGI